jgi:cyclopropane fatty-acyl-phospholipid synthase-like methyltransferase
MTLDEFFYQVFESLPRQGPGCTGATRKAFSYLPLLSKDAKILDIGCGSGTQTRDLAALTSGTIIAVDNYQQFLDSINAWAVKEGLEGGSRYIAFQWMRCPLNRGSLT